jgi:hypothetical protein
MKKLVVVDLRVDCELTPDLEECKNDLDYSVVVASSLSSNYFINSLVPME